MLYPIQNLAATSTIPMSGRAIARKKTKSERAAIAAMVLLGEIAPENPTKTQVARMVGVGIRSVDKALGLNAADRSAMSRGLLTLAAVPTVPSDQKIEAMVRGAGVDHVWAIMERFI
jgi:hypothetical protein